MERHTDEVRDRGFSDLVLVCTNDREECAGCGEGGRAVFERVVEWLRERDVLWSRVYVAETGCLALCGEGAALVIQPRDEWYGGVTPGEVEDVLARTFGPDAGDLGGNDPAAVPDGGRTGLDGAG